MRGSTSSDSDIYYPQKARISDLRSANHFEGREQIAIARLITKPDLLRSYVVLGYSSSRHHSCHFPFSRRFRLACFNDCHTPFTAISKVLQLRVI